ncbi:MAG: GDP-mannose 4,6-dehydratase, partial [Kiritimatiellae bacterium]|nr:GDP-mannose 4,6-dehydratase [Kiritimatiellia bacterium]
MDTDTAATRSPRTDRRRTRERPVSSTTRSRRCIVTGGCGFIGSALVRHLCREGREVLVVDKLTYAGCVDSLREAEGRYTLLVKDICDERAMAAAFREFRPDTVFHLAAESHVDRSIDGPGEFVRTNVLGTATLLQAALGWWREHPSFVFQHISTDEVYG